MNVMVNGKPMVLEAGTTVEGLLELLRMPRRKRIEHGRLDDTDNGRRRPDAEREREHGHSGEAGIFQQLAEGEFQIVHSKVT